MKHFFFLLLIIPFTSFAQINPSAFDDPNAVFTIVEKMPVYPGGMDAMMKFFQDEIKYPELEKQAKISGTCYATFVVEKDGSIDSAKILRGVKNAPAFDEEALRVLNRMLKWTPGIQNGKEVRVQLNVPVKFILPLSESDTTFLNKDWNLCERADAEYFRLREKYGYGYLVKDFYLRTGLPQMIGMVSSLDPIISEGKTTYYEINGMKSEEGNYKKDKKSGIWIIWDEDGKDSSLVNFGADGSVKYERVSTKLPLRDKPFDYVETMPVFPGGEVKMMEFIQKNTQYPITERNEGISGTCYITFVVERNGSVSNIKILKGVTKGPGLEAESLRVIKSMPDWSPGILGGKEVRVRFNLPIKFTLK